MQAMCVEFARDIFDDQTAHSHEFAPETQHPIISLMDEQHAVTKKGGTMRLGAYQCQLTPNTKAFQAYNTNIIYERHRHRYEFNNAYRTQLEQAGMVFSGVWTDGNLVEIVELKEHPFMIGVQFHPEFLSRPDRPHPLFEAFVKAATNSP